ncbi:MAG: helix-turn-helix transcriptional regulator [Flavobacteriales bacterium]|nr:helix-turn-helix transcriptional regulator [Flavobacteriales bacterium]
MTGKDNIQNAFLQQIKDKLPPNLSLVDELAELLNVSNDSVYRRIRGQTSLTFDEIKILSSQFGVSVDSLISESSDAVTFKYSHVDVESFDFSIYLKSIIKNLGQIKSFENSEMIYSAMDIPIFNYFEFEELAAFKTYFWLKMIYQFPDYEKKKFKIGEIDPEILSLGKEALRRYREVDTIEIWNADTINSTINQLKYCKDSGMFDSKEDFIEVCHQLKKFFEHIQLQAEKGVKIPSGHLDVQKAKYKVYYNEVLLANNKVLARLGGESRMLFISHNTLNLLITTNDKFCKETDDWMTNLMGKSTLISEVSEKHRNQFFMKIQERVDQLIAGN